MELAITFSSFIQMTQLTEKILNSAPRLIAVGAYCIGTNQIDMNAATENGIAVFNS